MLAAQRVQHHRHRVAVAVHELELDLGDRALHLQQRRPVRLVEDAPAHGEQVLEPAPADQVVGARGPASRRRCG